MVEKVRNLDPFLLGLSNLIRLSVSEKMIIILVFFLWFYPNNRFSVQKNLPQIDEALVFHLLHRPNFPPPPPKTTQKTLEKRPNALKQKTHDQTTGHRPGMIHLPSLPTEPAGGEAVDLRFFFAERRCCGSNFRMETTIVPVTGTCTIWGGEAQGDFFLFGKKRCLLVVVGLAFFLGVFDIYFSYIISSCMYVSYIISSYIKSYITYQKSIITYHLSCIIYH